MNDCIFCKIVKGEIPAEKVYEDDVCFAFLSINPVNDGHTLVIPKNHYRNYFETPEDVLGHLATMSKQVGIAIQKVTGAHGINIATNVEEAAGQAVFHTHIHIIPRYAKDELSHWKLKDYNKDAGMEIIEKIKKILQ